MDESKLIVFTIAVSAVGVYGTFLPSVSDVALGIQSPDEKQALREAELLGSGQLLLIAGLASGLSKSPLPLLLVASLALLMFGTYEYAMARQVRDV